MAASAQGIDVSAFQVGLSTAELRGFDFAFTRVSDGTGLTDANLKRNWGSIASAGIHRGGYHELRPGSGAAQAAYFLAALDTHGIRDGDMLAVVASDYTGVTGDEVLAWCERVKSGTGGGCPVIVYSDLSRLGGLGVCAEAGYPLWVAWPNPVPPKGGQIAPWTSWHLWQWGTRSVGGGGVVDADAYNGDAAEMTGWVQGHAHPPAPAPTFGVRYVGDGEVSLAKYCKAMRVGAAQVLWATADHRPNGYGPAEKGYFDAGDWERAMPKGTIIWAR
jgi:GH25 family lysozyme M1 (1,4-beta-N-acetylmuramidase)